MKHFLPVVYMSSMGDTRKTLGRADMLHAGRLRMRLLLFVAGWVLGSIALVDLHLIPLALYKVGLAEPMSWLNVLA